MTILEFCRNQAFWAMDALRGGKVKKAYDSSIASFLCEQDDRTNDVNMNTIMYLIFSYRFSLRVLEIPLCRH